MAKIRDYHLLSKSNHYLVHLEAGDYINPNEKIVGVWKGTLAEKLEIHDKRIIGNDEIFLKLWKNINPTDRKKI